MIFEVNTKSEWKKSFLFLLIILFQNNIQDLEQFFFRCWAWNKHSSLSYACLDHEPNHFSENNPMNIMRWSHGSSIWDKGEYWIKILNFSLQRFQIWPMKQPPTSVQNCNRHVWAMVLSIQPCSGQGEARPPHREEQSRYRALHWLMAFISCFQFFHEAQLHSCPSFPCIILVFS